MEYPTLFTAGTAWLVPDVVTASSPEEVTVHEAGHQWWYGIVGSNEVESAWIDEGITTYATGRAMAEAFPESYLEARYFGSFVPWAFRDIPLSRETYWNRRAGYLQRATSDTPSLPSYRYHPVTGRYITYNKTALWLHTAERWLGWPVMQQALRTFFERERFRHPQPDAFFAALEEAAGRDLTPFVDAVFRSSDVFDYGVESLLSTADGDRMRTTLLVRRHGEAIFPVDIVVAFEGGARVTERWDGRDRWKLFEYDREEPAVSAEIDPERVLLLDVNFTNNSMTRSPRGPEAATRWSLKWMVWLQDALLTWAFFV
jgi:aminopeptidase N